MPFYKQIQKDGLCVSWRLPAASQSVHHSSRSSRLNQSLIAPLWTDVYCCTYFRLTLVTWTTGVSTTPHHYKQNTLQKKRETTWQPLYYFSCDKHVTPIRCLSNYTNSMHILYLLNIYTMFLINVSVFLIPSSAKAYIFLTQICFHTAIFYGTLVAS
jgi:hypothetical protein